MTWLFHLKCHFGDRGPSSYTPPPPPPLRSEFAWNSRTLSSGLACTESDFLKISKERLMPSGVTVSTGVVADVAAAPLDADRTAVFSTSPPFSPWLTAAHSNFPFHEEAGNLYLTLSVLVTLLLPLVHCPPLWYIYCL